MLEQVSEAFWSHGLCKVQLLFCHLIHHLPDMSRAPVY